MLMNVMADENTPIRKIPTTSGKTILAQDPGSAKNSHWKNYPIVNGAKTTDDGGDNKKPPTTQGSSNTPVDSGGGGGGEYYGGYSEPAFDWAAYFAQLMAERQRRADEAYERNMKRIAESYATASNNLKSNYDSTESRLGAYRTDSMSDVNKDAETALQQAYINNMLNKKNLNQRLSAMGYNGGATESTMAQLANNYGNSRTGIDTTRNENISKLNQNYGDNLANALQQYNSAMTNLDMQKMQLEMEAEQQRQNAIDNYYSQVSSIAMDPSYLTALQSALGNMGAYSYTPSMATNDFTPGNVTQANSAANDANYAKYLAQARLDSSNGSSLRNIKNNLFGAVNSGNLDITSLYNILKQLGAA